MPPEELQALKQLQQMQREWQIVICAYDKGLGIIIINFEEFIRAVYDHLTPTQCPGHPYHLEVNDFQLDKEKKLIKDISNEGIENKIINKSDFDTMIADDMKGGQFYCNLKVHKEHSHTPPPRPITSGSGSIIENVGKLLYPFIQLYTNTAHYNKPLGAAKNTHHWVKKLHCLGQSMVQHYLLKSKILDILCKTWFFHIGTEFVTAVASAHVNMLVKLFFWIELVPAGYHTHFSYTQNT